MYVRILVLLTLGFFLLPVVPGRVAASCIPLAPAEQEAQADVIVDGTVLDIAVDGGRSLVTVGIDRVLKGAPGAVVLLEASLPGEIVAGEVPFHEGWPYWRLYLREVTPGSGRFFTSLCDGSRELPAPTEMTGRWSLTDTPGSFDGATAARNPL